MKTKRKRTAAERWRELTREERADARSPLVEELNLLASDWYWKRYTKHLRLALAVLREAAR